MNKKTLLFSIILLSQIFLLYSQNLVSYKGLIIDKTTKEPIIGATVYSDSLKIGTITNEKGEFILKTPENLTISIRNLGYMPINILPRKTDGNIIEMEPSVINIMEVTVDNNYAYQLIRNANNNAAIDTSIIKFSKGFYQKIAKEGKDYTVIHEFFFDAAWNTYGIQKWNITQARYAKKDTSRFEFNNFSMYAACLISVISIKSNLMPNSLNDIEKYYKFNISAFLNKNTDDEIAVVNCIPIKASKNNINFTGNLYINTHTFKLVKIQGTVKDLIPFKFWSPFRNPDLYFDIVFKDDPSGFIFDHANINFSMDLWSKSLKKTKISEDVKILFYKYNLSAIDSLKDVYIQNDTKYLKDIQYDAEFWKNNEIVKRTPIESNIIEKFERQKYFGNYFDKKQ